MSQDEVWLAKWREVVEFIEVNKRNPSRYDPAERGLYLTWLKHNKKLLNKGTMKANRIEPFKALLALCEAYKRKNQWE